MDNPSDKLDPGNQKGQSVENRQFFLQDSANQDMPILPDSGESIGNGYIQQPQGDLNDSSIPSDQFDTRALKEARNLISPALLQTLSKEFGAMIQLEWKEATNPK